eukprot:4662040-Prymnesium_polylepis.1
MALQTSKGFTTAARGPARAAAGAHPHCAPRDPRKISILHGLHHFPSASSFCKRSSPTGSPMAGLQ